MIDFDEHFDRMQKNAEQNIARAQKMATIGFFVVGGCFLGVVGFVLFSAYIIMHHYGIM
jgi:hypothetical protein